MRAIEWHEMPREPRDNFHNKFHASYVAWLRRRGFDDELAVIEKRSARSAAIAARKKEKS